VVHTSHSFGTMSTDGYSSDLEVVSKDVATVDDYSVDSKLASPEDSPTLDHPTKAAEMESGKPSPAKLDTAMVNGHSNGSIDAVMNGAASKTSSVGGQVGSGQMSPEDYSADPMLASALMSPLHDPLSMDTMFSPTRPALNRAPSILTKADTLRDVWELYKRAGPRYPASLDQLVMKYHHKHSSSWQLAHDLGAGSGIYAPTLARFFRHVHVSDPTASGIATSKKLLSTWSKENPKKRGRFTFSVGKPEEAGESVADGSLDMAVITESAHFVDAEATVRSIAQTLAPGGTLAIVTHRPSPKVAGNEKVGEAVQRLFDAWGPRPWQVACGTTGKSQQLFSLGLDFVPLPEELFKRNETRRITINAHGKPREFFRVPGADDTDVDMSPDDMMDMATSRVDEKEMRVELGEQDEQGSGWRHEVGWESFRTRIALLDTPETIARLEPQLKEIQDLIMKTSPNGVTVVIEWAVAVVLATRK